jgi:hypothetical protein
MSTIAAPLKTQARGGSIARLGSLTGVLFAALLAAVRLIEGNGLPDATASTSSVVAYWTSHRGSQMLVAVLASFAAVCLTWYAGNLRAALARAESGSSRLSNIAFGGALVAVAGMLFDTTVEYCAAHTAGHVPGTVTQTLSALQADTFLGMAAGFAIFGLAAGIAVLKTKVMSPKLGWLSVAAGVLWLTPGEFVAIFLSVVFVAASSVVLYRRS